MQEKSTPKAKRANKIVFNTKKKKKIFK